MKDIYTVRQNCFSVKAVIKNIKRQENYIILKHNFDVEFLYTFMKMMMLMILMYTYKWRYLLFRHLYLA